MGVNNVKKNLSEPCLLPGSGVDMHNIILNIIEHSFNIPIFLKIKYSSKRVGIENAPMWDTVDGNAQHNDLQQSSLPKPEMPNQTTLPDCEHRPTSIQQWCRRNLNEKQ